MRKNQYSKMLLATLVSLFCLAGQLTSAEELLSKTPPDHEGPFYPVTQQDDIDNDLVHVKGQTGVANGDILNLSGIVVNARGEAQGNITIEIWQTDQQGKYKHPRDSTPGSRDQNFQYWGAVVTGSDGTYYFKTIVPGAYEPRPAHIHFKVLKAGKVILTSQIYFKDPSLESKHFSLTSQTELQTAELQKAENGEFQAYFRIVI
jgi:protocatechuate 3,4-dioxygenase beta subunit